MLGSVYHVILISILSHVYYTVPMLWELYQVLLLLLPLLQPLCNNALYNVCMFITVLYKGMKTWKKNLVFLRLLGTQYILKLLR